jgi:tetratricopeptide (TPR) repeat protein
MMPSEIRFVHPLLRARDWQSRPQFDELCKWWREGGLGVCALVGIGGAGKTAIVDRFLLVLPDILPPVSGIPKNDSLPSPGKLFVFSFYDAPNPDLFLNEVAIWLGYTPNNAQSGKLSYNQVLRMLQTSGRCILVLDGLEKIQDDGARGGIFGQIRDGRLGDLVLRLAGGYLPEVSAIITTRFPIADLDDAFYGGQANHYREIPVEKISIESGVQLLKDRGVHGSDPELERIVVECGQHALTVDLAGGYLYEFEGGRVDALLEIGTLQEIEQAIKDELNPRRRAVLKQELRFAKVAHRYREALVKRDPASLALVERVCLFRLGASADTLTTIFTGPGKEGISGPELAALNAEDVRSKLQKLQQMRILNVSKSETGLQGKSDMHYTVHPAVRDGFLRGLDRSMARGGHDAVRMALGASLHSEPGITITDPNTLDLIEEIIHHSLESCHITEAIDLFENRLEASIRCIIMGDYSRVDRIARAISSALNPAEADFGESLSKDKWTEFLGRWALAKLGLGQLSAAMDCTEQIRLLGGLLDNKDLTLIEREAYFLSGQLARAKNESQQLINMINDDDDIDDLWKIIIWIADAYLDFLGGRTGAASHSFDECDRLFFDSCTCDGWLPFLSLPIFRGECRVLYLYRSGKEDLARELCEKTLASIENSSGSDEDRYLFFNMVPALKVAYAQCLLLSDPKRSQQILDDATEWAVLRDAKEILCRSSLIQGRLKAAEAISTFIADRKADLFKDALTNFDEGIHIARECGYSIYHIDLLVERALIHLWCGDADMAVDDLRIALTDGHKPLPESGFPPLLAATDPECGYAWGEGDARHLLGEALLLQVAQSIGREYFVPARFNELAGEVQNNITAARAELEKCLQLRNRIKDPKAAITERVMDQLNGGLLTNYPLHTLKKTDPTIISSQLKQLPVMSTINRTKAFVSYSHKDKKIFDEFRIMLAPAIQKDLIDLWDDTRIRPGTDWRDEIKDGIAAAKVAVLLVSSNFLASDFITKNELPPLLRAAKDDGAIIFWIYLSSCLYKYTEIETYQAAHDISRPLDKLTDAERMETLMSICDRLIQIVSNP